VDIAARLTVLGSLNMDISVTVRSLPGPGATVLGSAAVFAPGGKGANQAVAAARLGGERLPVAMIGCTGDDDFGRTLRAALRAEGISDSAVRTVAGVPTGIAMITVDQAGENIITVSPGANHELSAADVSDIARAAGTATAGSATALASGGVLVISAEVPVPVISAALGASAGRMLRVLNLAPAPPEAAGLIAAGPDWLVVNESEAAAVLGRPVSGLADAAAAAADLAAAGARNAVVTAGAAGAAYCGPRASAGGGTRDRETAGHRVDEGESAVVTVPGFKVQATDTVGAGDTFVGALAVALAGGVPPAQAVTAASAAGATAATRPGTQSGMPRPADILAVTGHRWPLS
jgi:ribokinase